VSLSKPIIFTDRKEIPNNTEIVEAFEMGIEELFLIEHPQFISEERGRNEALKEFQNRLKDTDIWIYYPWRNQAIHSLSEESYFKLRTARNRNIITQEEQSNYRNAKVGIAGLSVGSAILSMLVMTGGPKTIKIADFDVIETTNLNRIRANFLDVGLKKTEATAKDVWELDPFAELDIWNTGINSENINKFILQEPKLDIFIDAVDNIELKILARKVCRENNIPVLMATDNGEGIILDVERFDDESKRPLLHGLMENIDLKRPWMELTKKILEEDNIAASVRKSIPEIGKTISQVPQIGSAASLGGIMVSSAVRKIANKQELISGRYIIDFEKTWKDFKKL